MALTFGVIRSLCGRRFSPPWLPAPALQGNRLSSTEGSEISAGSTEDAAGSAISLSSELNLVSALAQRGTAIFDGALHLQNLPTIQFRGKHFPGRSTRLWASSTRKAYIAALLGKESAQINLWIKNVVVIANDDIGPDRTHPGKVQKDKPDVSAPRLRERSG